jgi:hypothetical protein
MEDHPLSDIQTAYSIYSELPSISDVRFLYPQLEDEPCHGDKESTENVILVGKKTSV